MEYKINNFGAQETVELLLAWLAGKGIQITFSPEHLFTVHSGKNKPSHDNSFVDAVKVALRWVEYEIIDNAVKQLEDSEASE